MINQLKGGFINMINYPQFVNKDKIKCCPQNKDYRYYLEIDCDNINSVNKTAMIVLQNPSKAREYESDRTVNKVLNYLYGFGYGRIIITNVVPFYGTDIANILNKNYDKRKINDENCKIIKKISKKVDKVFVAWGWIYPKQKLSKESKKELEDYYCKRINEIKECLCNVRDVSCYCINRENKKINRKYMQPRHVRGWAKGKKEKDFKIFDFDE